MSNDAPRYQMFWDCSYCGAEKLLGVSHRHCPNCGAAQNPDDRYFPPEEERIALEDHKFIGADKQCGACDTPNSASVTFCINCGSNMADGSSVKLAHEKENNEEAPPPPSPPPKKSNTAWFVILGVIILGIICCGAFGSCTSSAGVTVNGHSWERSISVDTYKKVSEKAWKENVPTKAKKISCVEKEQSTKKEQDGEDCKKVDVDDGDGSFHQEEKCTPKYKEIPVYGEYCSYDIKKWVAGKALKNTGADLSPSWPSEKIKKCKKVKVGCKRKGAKTEKYTVRFNDKKSKKEHACNFDEAKWKGFANGSQWEAEITMLGSMKCESLKAK